MSLRLAVALDLAQDDPEHLLRRAASYARAAEAALDLVYVGHGEAAQARLESLRGELPEPIRGRAVLLDGDVVDALVNLSSTLDVLIVGPRHPKGLERWLHGPIAVRVLKRARCPVLIPKTDRFGSRPARMLMGIDLASDRRDRSLALAGSLAASFAATLDLVHAIPGSLPVRRAELREAVRAAWIRAHKQALKGVGALLDKLPPDARGEGSIEPGEPEDVLAHRSEDYDLVVVGNRNRRGLGGLVLGPVSSSVMPRAHSDVLVLPTASLASVRP